MFLVGCVVFLVVCVVFLGEALCFWSLGCGQQQKTIKTDQLCIKITKISLVLVSHG